MDILAAEADRVVNAPYPTELKSLHDIVSQTSCPDICSWATSYTCRTGPVAQALLDALPRWPYILETVTRLSCAVEIRDVLIQREPSLLPSLLSQALGSRTEKYVEASVALLSHPLPQGAALPATAQDFLLQLFEKAAAHPDASTVRHIHRLVYGACQPILGILSPSILSHLEEYIFSILKSSSGVEDQSLGMYCLSIMRVLLEKFQTGVASEDMWPNFEHSADSSNSQWTPESIRQFFDGNKTHKTMQLLVLRVIWACRPESADSSGQGLNGVTLVNQILAGVSKSAVAEWSSKNMVILRKLQEKCLVPDMHPSLRFQVMSFLGALSDKVSLPAQGAAFYEKSLLELHTLLLDRPQLDMTLRLSLPRLSARFSPVWWHSFLSKILDLLMDSPPETLFRSADCYVLFLDNISSLVESNPQCRQGLLAALSNGQSRQRTEVYFSGLKPLVSTTLTSFNYCAASYMSLIDRLRSSFCSLLLRTALAATQEETTPIRGLLPAILKQHAIVERNHPPCSMCSRTRPKAIQPAGHFIEVEATPVSQDSSLNWKDRLALLIQTQAKQQQTALITSFTNICHELEARCENVEGPLRQERGKVNDLESRYAVLSKAYSELEGHVMDKDLRISALEAETDLHEIDMAAASQDSRELMQRIDDATRELRKTQEESERAIAAARQEKHALEVEHATAIACKQEALEQLREQLHSSKADLEDLRLEINGVEESRRHDNAEYGKLCSEKEHLEQKLAEGQHQLAQVNEERTVLDGKRTALEQDVQKLREDLEGRRNQHDNLLAELEDVKRQSRDDLQKMSGSFEDVMSKAQQEWLDVKTRLEQELETSRNELAQAEEGFQQQHEANKHKSAEYRKRIDRLTKECSKKDAQVVEAQEMRNRLMSAMGISGAMAPPPEQIKSSVLPVRSASTTATPRTSSASQMLFTPAPDARGDNEETEDEDLNSSFMSDASADNGPTPKRARPRPTPKLASTQPGRTSIGPRSARSIMRTRSAITRPPLQDMPTNRSPVRHRSPSKVAFQGLQNNGFGVSTAERREMEDWSFSGDCIITGTPGYGLKNKQDDGLDESTADV